MRNVALACTYYPTDWRDGLRDYLAGSGFQVARAQSFADQGLLPDIADIDEYGWTTGIEMIIASIGQISEGVEAVVVTGSGSRTLAAIADLEEVAGCPVVGADIAVYWDVARTLGLPLKPSVLGALTDA